MIPLPHNLSAYPSRFFGFKGKLLRHILPLIPDGTSTFLDPMGGSGVVGWAFKQAGVRIILNDILRSAHLRHRALVANNTEHLTDEDLEVMGTAHAAPVGPFGDRYLPTFGQANARYMDGLVLNIPRLSTPAKRDLATILPIIAAAEGLHYNAYHLSPSGSLTGQHLAHVDLQESVETFARTRLPRIIVDNGKANEAHWGDALALIPRTKADVMYLDPPYAGESGNYEATCAVLDDWVRCLQGDSADIRNSYDAKADLPPYTPFYRRTSAIVGFMAVFERAEHIPLIIVSYNTTSAVSPAELVAVARSFGRKTNTQRIPHPRPTTTKGMNTSTEEVLITCEAA